MVRGEEKATDGEMGASKLPWTVMVSEAGAVEEVKPSMAGTGKTTTTTKVLRVKQEYIDNLLAHGSQKPFLGMEMLSDRGDRWRSLMARATAAVDKIRQRDEDILVRYRLKGYAEVEMELIDKEALLGN